LPQIEQIIGPKPWIISNPIYVRWATKRHKRCKHGCAPLGALLAALWGDKPSPESSGYSSSEAVRTFTGVLLGT